MMRDRSLLHGLLSALLGMGAIAFMFVLSKLSADALGMMLGILIGAVVGAPTVLLLLALFAPRHRQEMPPQYNARPVYRGTISQQPSFGIGPVHAAQRPSRYQERRFVDVGTGEEITDLAYVDDFDDWP